MSSSPMSSPVASSPVPPAKKAVDDEKRKKALEAQRLKRQQARREKKAEACTLFKIPISEEGTPVAAPFPDITHPTQEVARDMVKWMKSVVANPNTKEQVARVHTLLKDLHPLIDTSKKTADLGFTKVVNVEATCDAYREWLAGCDQEEFKSLAGKYVSVYPMDKNKTDMGVMSVDGEVPDGFKHAQVLGEVCRSHGVEIAGIVNHARKTNGDTEGLEFVTALPEGGERVYVGLNNFNRDAGHPLALPKKRIIKTAVPGATENYFRQFYVKST